MSLTGGSPMLREIPNRGHRPGHQTFANKHPRSIPSVLIVDDDVDTVLVMESILRPLGLNVDFALDVHDAQRKISSGKYGIIFLDWLLDPQTSADQVVARAVRLLEKFSSPH